MRLSLRIRMLVGGLTDRISESDQEKRRHNKNNTMKKQKPRELPLL
jgi:hypothetical protein